MIKPSYFFIFYTPHPPCKIKQGGCFCLYSVTFLSQFYFILASLFIFGLYMSGVYIYIITAAHFFWWGCSFVLVLFCHVLAMFLFCSLNVLVLFLFWFFSLEHRRTKHEQTVNCLKIKQYYPTA